MRRAIQAAIVVAGWLSAHGLASAVTVGVWIVLPIVAWIVVYLSLLLATIFTGEGIGSPAAGLLGVLLLGVGGIVLAGIVCAVGMAGDLVRRGLGLPITATPLAIGAVSTLVSGLLALGQGQTAFRAGEEALAVTGIVLAVSASYWVPLAGAQGLFRLSARILSGVRGSAG